MRMGTRLVGHAIVLVRGNVGEELLIVVYAAMRCMMLYAVICMLMYVCVMHVCQPRIAAASDYESISRVRHEQKWR
jgi:hypothetical protein